MIVGFADRCWEYYQHWISNDKKIVKRINLLFEDIKRKISKQKIRDFFDKKIKI